jgi:hypothetical protein
MQRVDVELGLPELPQVAVALGGRPRQNRPATAPNTPEAAIGAESP